MRQMIYCEGQFEALRAVTRLLVSGVLKPGIQHHGIKVLIVVQK